MILKQLLEVTSKYQSIDIYKTGDCESVFRGTCDDALITLNSLLDCEIFNIYVNTCQDLTITVY